MWFWEQLIHGVGEGLVDTSPPIEFSYHAMSQNIYVFPPPPPSILQKEQNYEGPVLPYV